MYYQSKKTIEWKKKDYTRTILLFALHTLIIIALYAIMLSVNAFKSEVDTVEFLTRPETIRNLLYVAISVLLIGACIYLYFYNENCVYSLGQCVIAATDKKLSDGFDAVISPDVLSAALEASPVVSADIISRRLKKASDDKHINHIKSRIK